jgi:hypothetical protein
LEWARRCGTATRFGVPNGLDETVSAVLKWGIETQISIRSDDQVFIKIEEAGID